MARRGIEEGERAKLLAILRGDLSEKSQERYIDQTRREKANSILIKFQQSTFEAEQDVPF